MYLKLFGDLLYLGMVVIDDMDQSIIEQVDQLFGNFCLGRIFPVDIAYGQLLCVFPIQLSYLFIQLLVFGGYDLLAILPVDQVRASGAIDQFAGTCKKYRI